MKRFFDFLFALLVLLILSIPMFLIAILVRLKLGSPILFQQKRPGKNGNIFSIYKFRTMSNATDSTGELLSDEIRLTTFGKFLRRFSLDELPQLINVLKGDISLVGPRPLLVEYLNLYTPQQAKRHNVRPGITGWAQVNGRNSISWEDKLELDVWYVDNQSFWLDLKILFMTVKKVVISEGINQNGQATMEKFTGSKVKK